MMRRARISVRPNVRPVGRGPSSSQDGQSILASTVNSLAAGETSQTIEMVSNVTDNEPSPEDSAIKFPEASEFTSTHDTLSEKALCNLGENGQTCVTFDDCIPADTSLKRRESVSDVCNIAQPRVIPKPLSAKALESSVSKSVTMASCSVAPVSVPEDQTVTEDEGLQSRGQQKLPVRGKRPRKAKNLGLSFAGVCVPSPEDLAVSMRKESESQPSTSAVVHETSSMSSYQERIIKSRMLKQLMKDELRKGRTKHKPHLEYINPLDHSKMTMRDLIYYLPDGNPMKSCMKDEQTGKENLRLLSNERKEIPQKEAEEEKDDCDEDLSQNDDELVVPKVKVAEDGSLILDEDSLTVKVSKTTGPAIVEENDPLFECGSTATYSSFRKIRHVKPWSIKETDMFFLAISMVGTDFSIIGRLFPHRPRKEIKNKFRKEERINAWRIDKAFREKRPYDEQFFSMLLGRILTTEKKKRNVNMRDSKAKKVNNQESKPKKKKMKTKIEVSVMENAQQDESHITIEEEESDCRVTEGNMEMTEKNEDSINVLKVGNKTLPNKKPGKRRNTEEVLDTSSAKPVDGKKRKMKTSVEIINCDKVGDAQTSSEEPESTMEHTASGDRSNGATGMLSPSSRRCCQNPTANIGKRVRKRIPGSPENREICSAEDESRVNSICVSTVENEAAILNREEVKKAGQIITPGEDFLEEPENMDCQLNRFEGHEDMFSSGSSVKHRPREACTLTSIPAKKSCQEKEYSASSSPDGVKVDTVNDESAIKYIQNVPTENGEKESSEQNGIQDEMARGTDIMDPSLEKRNQIPGLAQVAQIQRSSAVQSNDVSLTITNAAAKVSMPPVFEGRDDLENSFADNQKDKQFDNQILEHEEAWSGCLSHEDLFDSSSTIQHRPREACTLTSITAEKSCQEKEYSASSSPDGVKMDTVHNESAIKYIQNVLPENTEKDSSGQNWTLDEMSSRAYHPLRSPSIREKIPEAVMEKDMQPVIAISSTVKAEVVTHLPPKGDSCGVITTVEMVTEAVTTDVTEQEPTFILTLVPVSEVPPPPESTEQQSEMLLPASQRYSTQYSTLERDFVSDQVLNTSSSSVTQKDTKDPEDYFAKHSSKRNVPEATKKEEATLNEEPEQLDILPSSPKTVQPISVKSSTEEAVTDSAKVEMSQDTVSLSDLSVKNKNKETAEDQSSPTFKSEEEILKSNPLITPLFLKALKFQNNNDDTETERKMPLDLPISSHSSASDINATYSPSSPTKVYSSISEPAQCEFLCANVKEIDEEPTNVSEYFLSDIFTEVKESESD
ncbi:transcription factor TFIIIB component B'' homolog isoform X11 [Brienomyrus brachyistius]|uniref:transcription factor TFIIIB component B'' homolog isoform X10 n=1 Tax=Brienomyrus brachyistius TaxID=42636 RepID=UPI0020B3C8E1|nr:transcription factor TFIIIB component B'' homolog isoform X10 [Brienomyrus brachyistius]XP_048861181.1 transcription factor TFIIIB component B'' homolog isoform X11 [Brienomyrus brachyistius]